MKTGITEGDVLEPVRKERAENPIQAGEVGRGPVAVPGPKTVRLCAASVVPLDITVVGGYRSEAIDAQGAKLVLNERWTETDELCSLDCALESLRDQLVSTSVYRYETV